MVSDIKTREKIFAFSKKLTSRFDCNFIGDRWRIWVYMSFMGSKETFYVLDFISDDPRVSLENVALNSLRTYMGLHSPILLAALDFD